MPIGNKIINLYNPLDGTSGKYLQDGLNKGEGQGDQDYIDRFTSKKFANGDVHITGSVFIFNPYTGAGIPPTVRIGDSGWTELVGFTINCDEFSEIGGHAVVKNNEGASDLYFEAYDTNVNDPVLLDGSLNPDSAWKVSSSFYTMNGSTANDTLFPFIGRAGNLDIVNINRLGFFAYYGSTAPNLGGQPPVHQWIEFMIKLMR